MTIKDWTEVVSSIVRCPKCGTICSPIEDNYDPWYECPVCHYEFKEDDL